MKSLIGFFLVLLTTTFAFANIEAINGTTNIGNFYKMKCSTGMTCSREKDYLKIVSSPSLTSALTISGAEATDAVLTMQADESDDSGDDWKLSSVASGNAFTFANDTSGSFVTKFSLSTAGVITYADSETLTDASDVLTFAFDDAAANVTLKAFEATDSKLVLQADESDDSGDDWELKSAASGNAFTISNDTSGSQVAKVTVSSSLGNVTGPGTGYMAGFLKNLVSATATTITAAQCGMTFYNAGAVQMELPEASTVLGCELTFVTLNATNFDVNPDTGDQILTLTNAAGDAIRNATVGNSVRIQAVSASQWAQISVNGTWSDIN